MNKHHGTQHNYDPINGEWNDSLAGEFLWSNVNVSEAVPDVMTPSTWSLWQIFHYDTNPVKFPGNQAFCGNICGRPYLNLSLLASLNQAVGRDFRKGLLGDLVGSVSADLNIPMIPFSPVIVIWTVLPGLLKAQRHARLSYRNVPEFAATTPQWCKDTLKEIQTGKDKSSLMSMWQESIRPKFFQACKMLRSVTMSFSDLATKLRLQISGLVGEIYANTIMSTLSGASADLESLGPLVGLAKVQDGRLSREEYMDRYGHRGPHEMELFAPGSAEDPSWFEKRLADSTRSMVNAEERLAGQYAEWEKAWEQFQTKYTREAQQIQKRLTIVAESARHREAVRSEVTRITRVIRQFLLRVGDVTKLGDGVFFLSLNEMMDVLGGDKTTIAYIPARRETYSKYSALPPYPSIIIGKFDPFQWAADPNHRSDYFDSRTTMLKKEKTIKGFAGAAGCVDGIVRRIDCAEDGNQIQPGKILVTVTTNVGWTPLFPRLAAIVTDVGAPLSHAAIVAREMGIPAVVGCGNATVNLKTGDRIRVDGGRGVVEILS